MSFSINSDPLMAKMIIRSLKLKAQQRTTHALAHLANLAQINVDSGDVAYTIHRVRSVGFHCTFPRSFITRLREARDNDDIAESTHP